MRWLFIPVVAAAWISLAVNASEPVAESTPVPEVASPVMIYDLAPAPVPGVKPHDFKTVAEMKPASKPKLAQRKTLKKSILSRTAINQMALLAVKHEPETPASGAVFDDGDADSGADDLDFHRSFSRPRVAHQDDSDDQDDGLALEVSDHVKVRLFVARMKAVEAHQLVMQADQQDDGVLSDTVKLRLALARMKAIQAHEKKFS